MLAAVDRVICRHPVARCCTASWPGRSTSEGATRRIEDAARRTRESGWLDALGPGATIVEVLSTLLALLELAKRGELRLGQAAAFAPMVITRESASEAA